MPIISFTLTPQGGIVPEISAQSFIMNWPIFLGIFIALLVISKSTFI